MVRPENINSKLAYLCSVLKKLTRFQLRTSAEIFADSDLTAALERYLFLAAQASIDAMEMYCKYKQLGRPESMSDAVRLLQKAGVIEAGLAEKLFQMIGFRNYLSHGYEQLDPKVLDSVLRVHLKDLEVLAGALQAQL